MEHGRKTELIYLDIYPNTHSHMFVQSSTFSWHTFIHILDWPKNLVSFFHYVVWKNLNEHNIFPGFPCGSVVKNSPSNTGAAGCTGSIPGSGRCPGGGNGSPLQYSCPRKIPWTEKPGEATVHGVIRSLTRLSNWTCTHAHNIFHLYIYVHVSSYIKYSYMFSLVQYLYVNIHMPS